jgi:hypothetical protein
MKRLYFLPFIVLFALPTLLFSQSPGYQIKVKIDGFEGRETHLGYYYGDKQYLKDTAYLEADGYFYFEAARRNVSRHHAARQSVFPGAGE